MRSEGKWDINRKRRSRKKKGWHWPLALVHRHHNPWVWQSSAPLCAEGWRGRLRCHPVWEPHVGFLAPHRWVSVLVCLLWSRYWLPAVVSTGNIHHRLVCRMTERWQSPDGLSASSFCRVSCSSPGPTVIWMKSCSYVSSLHSWKECQQNLPSSFCCKQAASGNSQLEKWISLMNQPPRKLSLYFRTF